MVENAGSRIRRLRELQCLSQEALATLANVKVTTLSDLENGKRTTRVQTIKKICDILGVDANLFLPEFKETISSSDATPVKIAHSHAQLEEMVQMAPVPVIDPARYLRDLRKKLDIHLSLGDHIGAARAIRTQIKSFCIATEMYSTTAAAEDNSVKKLRYSCSAILDDGLDAYAKDAEWRLLLQEIGTAVKVSRKEAMRVLFFDIRRRYTGTEFFTITQIIREHLTNLVSVALYPSHALGEDVNSLKNMAIFERYGMLAATDQVAWDLAFFANRHEIEHAVQKHEFFVRQAVYLFYPRDQERVAQILRGILMIDDK